MNLSKDFTDNPYLHFPDVPPSSHRLVGLRRLWEANRKALKGVYLGRVDFMDLISSLRRLKSDPDNLDCPKRNLTYRWIEGWYEHCVLTDRKEILEEARYLARSIFLWEGPLPKVIEDLEEVYSIEDDDLFLDLFESVEHKTEHKTFKTLSLTIKGSGEVSIGEIINTPFYVEGDVKVSIESAQDNRLVGVKISSR